MLHDFSHCVYVCLCSDMRISGYQWLPQLRQPPRIWRTAACKSTWPERPLTGRCYVWGAQNTVFRPFNLTCASLLQLVAKKTWVTWGTYFVFQEWFSRMVAKSQTFYYSDYMQCCLYKILPGITCVLHLLLNFVHSYACKFPHPGRDTTPAPRIGHG